MAFGVLMTATVSDYIYEDLGEEGGGGLEAHYSLSLTFTLFVKTNSTRNFTN